jgi:hypothetical protein
MENPVQDIIHIYLFIQVYIATYIFGARTVKEAKGVITG